MQRTSKAKPNFSKLRGKCSSGKIRLRDKIEAIDILHIRRNKSQFDLAAKGATKANEARAYKCSDCNGWHLTSRATWGYAPALSASF